MPKKLTDNTVNVPNWEPTVLNNVGGKPGGQAKNIPKSSYVTQDKKRHNELDENDVKMIPPTTHDFKLTLQKARYAKKMTQKDLASTMGLKPVDITNWEAGKGLPPTGEQKAKLQKILGIKLPRI